MSANQKLNLHKAALAAAIGMALGTGVPQQASADVYTFTWSGMFRMLDPLGAGMANTSITGKTANQYETPISGTLTYDTTTGAGSATMQSFLFFNNPIPAVATGITLQAIGNGTGFGTTGNLVLTNMLFNWGGNNGIPVSLVWDATGLFNSLNGSSTGTITGTATGSIRGAADGTFTSYTGTTDATGGYLNLGTVPIATTKWNTSATCVTGGGNSGACMGVAVSGTLPLVADTTTNNNDYVPAFMGGTGQLDPGMGGNPMAAGPFQGYNANFDMSSITLSSFQDKTPPAITLNSPGNNPAHVTQGTTYTDAGATCTDAAPVGGSLTVTTSGTVNTATPGTYTLTYSCTDLSGNAAAQKTRSVIVDPAGAPTISLVNNDTAHNTDECGTSYTDPGATVTPASGSCTVTSPITASSGSVNSALIGSYTLTYTATDSCSVSATPVNRTVNVVDTLAPVITISGGNTQTVQNTQQSSYTPPTATAVDACDGSVTVSNVVSINWTFSGDSTTGTVQYSATDKSSHTANANLTVTVQRAEPVISLSGNQTVTLSSGTTFTDPGVSVHDVQEGDATYNSAGTKTCPAAPASCYGEGIVISGSGASLSGTKPADGTYTITYNTTDKDGNAAAPVTRTVIVGAKYHDSNFTMIDPAGSFVGGASDIAANWNGVAYTSTAALDVPANDMTLVSVTPTPFFGFTWKAHGAAGDAGIRVFGPGTYSFETCPPPIDNTGTASDGSTHCLNADGTPKNTTLTATVGAGQLGAHMLFDWGSAAGTPCGVANCNIDVFVVWNQNATFAGSPNDSNNDLCAKGALWDLASTDPDGDGIPGVKMIDGAFVGFNANFNLSTVGVSCTTSPITHTSSDPSLGGTGSADGFMLSGLLGGMWFTRRKRRIRH